METATAAEVRDGHLITRHPATGAETGSFPVSDAAGVAAAVDRAREAAHWWSELDFATRRAILLECRAVMAGRVRELMHLIRVETGKSVSDAFTEISTSFEHLKWAPKNARRVLGPRRVPTPLTLWDHAAHLEYRPYGVVAVIGPWNYPLHTPMGSIIYALAAGNTVVFKPSEYTPGVGQWLTDVIGEVAGRPIVTVVHGLGDVGAKLCEADVDKIAFTGSVATARKVATAAAQRLVPTLIEGGGKDAVIVDADAKLDSAADFTIWAAMTNAGQSCTGFERVYVVDEVADQFIEKLVVRAERLSVGTDDDSNVGPITMPGQLDIIASHIQDAVDRGATAVVGGPEAVRPPYVHPTILTDVPKNSTALTEETFGPVLVVNRVPDAQEALRQANATRFGLGGAVFGRRHAFDLARRMRSGMTAVNSGFAFAAIPALPFGGVGESGYGRAHGDDGLREFAYAKSIARRRAPQLLPLMSMRRRQIHNRLIERFLGLGGRRLRPARWAPCLRASAAGLSTELTFLA